MERRHTLESAIAFAFLERIEDPRHHNRFYPLHTLMFCILVGVLCGANDVVNIAVIAEKKRKFIGRYVPLPEGEFPSHDTLGRLLYVLDPEAITVAFAQFMAKMTGRHVDDILNIDGKTIRGVMTKIVRGKKGSNVEDQVHMVTAYSTLRGYVCATMRSKAVASEVAAAQDLLRLLNISGSTVTMDAGHTVIKTLQMIVERGANAVVGVKANCKRLFGDIKRTFKRGDDAVVIEETEHAHGRIEHRKYTIVAATGVAVTESFTTLKSFIRTERQRVFPSGKIRKPAATFYASTHDVTEARRIVDCVRRRWGIENSLHYVLDVAFDQDASRLRTGHAAENLSAIVQLCLNLLRRSDTPGSIQSKRFAALADEEVLAGLLAPLAT